MRKKTAVITIFTVFTLCVFIFTLIGTAETQPLRKTKTNKLLSPVRIAFDSNGNLVVSEYRQGLIITLDRKSLEVIRWFPIDGKPLGVACVNNLIIVGNETKGCLEVYKKRGRKLSLPCTPVQKPMDLAVDKNNKRLFAIDGVQKAVKVFSLKGGLLQQTIPASPPNANILANPTAIAVDSTRQEFYVSDYGDRASSIYARVQIFDYDGNLTGTISGKQGMFGQRFSRPQGLAVDGKGHLLMIDCFVGEIMVFDLLSGELLKTFGEYGTEPGQLRLPFDLVFDPAAKAMFVTNNRCARIEVFKRVRGF